MIRNAFFLAFAALSTTVRCAEPAALAAASPILNPEKEGQELAAKLRESAPAQDSEFTGVLEITSSKGSQQFIPILSRITVSPTNWYVTYRSNPTNTVPPQTLTITHAPGQKPAFRLTTGTKVNDHVSLAQPFASSDFWLVDLGLEFFHWPKQRAIRAEMRRGQPCRVLESSNTNVSPYSRVVSWIDNESGGVIEAEAYDSANRLLKRFALGSFKKVEGQWQLRDMRIRNVQTEQQTQLKFDLRTK